jgi:hypothetical protein
MISYDGPTGSIERQLHQLRYYLGRNDIKPSAFSYTIKHVPEPEEEFSLQAHKKFTQKITS